MTELNFQVAEFLVRTFAGILFLMQGYDKLFRIKMPNVVRVFEADANQYHVPRPMLLGIAYYSSLAEFIGGLLLLLGLFSNWALYALGLDLLMVCFAFSYMQPMWNMKYVMPRFALIILLLLLPQKFNLISLDKLLLN